MNSLLFVYGTLRKHEKNHHLLAQSACINEQARTKGSLFTAKEGPTAVFNGEGYIYGEVYEADELCIHKLDQFFQGYHKQTVFVETDVGIKNALIYFMNKEGCLRFYENKQRRLERTSDDQQIEKSHLLFCLWIMHG